MEFAEAQNTLRETNPREIIPQDTAKLQPQCNPNPGDNVHNAISTGGRTTPPSSLSPATPSTTVNGRSEIVRNDEDAVVGEPVDTGSSQDADKMAFIIKLDPPDLVHQTQQPGGVPIDEFQSNMRVSFGSTCNDTAVQGGCNQASSGYRDNVDVKPPVQLNASLPSNAPLDWGLFQKDLLTLQQTAANIGRVKELEKKFREVNERYEMEKKKHTEAVSMLNSEVERLLSRLKEVAPQQEESDWDEAAPNSQIDAQLDEIEKRLNELETNTMTRLTEIKNNRLEILERIKENKIVLSTFFESIMSCYKDEVSVSGGERLDDVNTKGDSGDAMDTNPSGEDTTSLQTETRTLRTRTLILLETIRK